MYYNHFFDSPSDHNHLPPLRKKKKKINQSLFNTRTHNIHELYIHLLFIYLFLRAKRVKLNTRAQPRVRVCVNSSVYARSKTRVYIYIYLCVRICIYIYMCVKCGSNGRCCVNSPRPSEVAV